MRGLVDFRVRVCYFETMKKFLSGIFIVLFAAGSVVAGLNVLPHAHGQDFDHSQHKTCPVYQAGQAAFFAEEAVAQVLVFSLFVSFILFSKEKHSEFSPEIFSSLRAPPVSL